MKKLCLPKLRVFTKSFSLLFFLVFFSFNPELVFASEEERSMFAKGRDPSETPDWSVESNQDSAYFGISVSSAGDVNGDGYSDVIVGAYTYDNGETDEGRAYVYHGGSSGPSSSPDWVAESDQAESYFGRYVSSAGDVNGDGYSDVIVSAYYYDNGQTDEGRVFVYHGSSSGLSSSPDWVAESNQAGPRFGRCVSTAGDVNGDGYSDVIVGAYRYDNGETDEGRVYVYHGGSSGLSSSPDWVAESNQSYAYFGYSVSAGDVNGDGYSDVIVGAYGYDNGETNEGRVFVYHGSPSGLSSSPSWTAESDKPGACFGVDVSTANDVNGDGYSDVIVGAYRYSNGETNEGGAYVYHGSSSGLSASPSWTAEPDQADVYFGYSVSAGDVNGDGYSDVIVGAYGYDNGETDEGRVYVYHGGSSGLSISPDWTAESNQDNSGFGGSVFSAGDVNGDGYSDVIVGAIAYDNGETDEGMAFLYFGNSSGIEDYTDYGENTKLSVFPYISINTFDIKFSISEEKTQEEIILSVYNKVGMKIANLFTGKKAEGVYTVKWYGVSSSSEPLSNDIYLISLKKGEKERLVRKILLMR